MTFGLLWDSPGTRQRPLERLRLALCLCVLGVPWALVQTSPAGSCMFLVVLRVHFMRTWVGPDYDIVPGAAENYA